MKDRNRSCGWYRLLYRLRKLHVEAVLAIAPTVSFSKTYKESNKGP